MRVVVQRVAEASVTVAGRETGRIGPGFVVLAGFRKGDNEEAVRWMARKVASLRVFEDEAERMSLALDAVQGSVLVVSQFTLYGDVRKGARPSFDASAAPGDARALYDRFVAAMREELPGRVETGEFQASMQVSLVNDGPVTIVIDRD
ncbi:MAG: D-aminoacyl-tRNA deacylase [Candidatus Krumholzibacteria bacterium]|nr:D-aminoacyl-tRNA deacylase [Candidatus Krumholzibacteria bacterium]MDH5268879.1 D-aminoacyl-tRNA deacylase [Candidatus Krumholzibacteria bacterium]